MAQRPQPEFGAAQHAADQLRMAIAEANRAVAEAVHLGLTVNLEVNAGETGGTPALTAHLSRPQEATEQENGAE